MPGLGEYVDRGLPYTGGSLMYIYGAAYHALLVLKVRDGNPPEPAPLSKGHEPTTSCVVS